jgi:peptidoglycan/xylan/chitin deacetylase (PgdA/CDA1 family)
MKYYWIKTNALIKKIFPKYIWDIPNTENKIYLSFDDGPIPEVTEWVLDQLKKYHAKATFFCIGDNIQKHPELFKKVIQEGHAIGNHTFNHLNGWKTTTENYVENVRLAETASCKLKTEHCKLFRPPYGKIKPSQSKRLMQLGYKIIMWDVLSADFDRTIEQEQCLENVISNVKSGSIIVFHDSLKASQNLKHTLPKTLELLSKKGFVFEIIS